MSSLKEDHLGMSTNSWIDTSSGVMKFYLVVHAADLVSIYIQSLLLSPAPHVQMLVIIHMTLFMSSLFILSLYDIEAWVQITPAC